MPEIKEVFDKANITHDSKARRVLNTAPDKLADITLSELVNGVTIERIETLKVPVYQYGGQITIHGIFRDIPPDMRVNGYKSLLFNGNKSLGVKYVAIDNAKKHLLLEAAHYRNRDLYKWNIHIDSMGCEAWFVSMDKNAIIEAFKNTPDDLYIGFKHAAELYPAGYAVIINIGAIYDVNLWKLIKALTGIENQAELDKLKEIERLDYEKREAEYKAEREAALLKRQAELREAMNNFHAPDNWKPFNGTITEAGTYAQIAKSLLHDDPVLFVYKVKTFGKRFKISTKIFRDFKYVDWEVNESKIRDIKSINGWQIS